MGGIGKRYSWSSFQTWVYWLSDTNSSLEVVSVYIPVPCSK